MHFFFPDRGDLYMWGKNKFGNLGFAHQKDQFFPWRVSKVFIHCLSREREINIWGVTWFMLILIDSQGKKNDVCKLYNLFIFHLSSLVSYSVHTYLSSNVFSNNKTLTMIFKNQALIYNYKRKADFVSVTHCLHVTACAYVMSMVYMS